MMSEDSIRDQQLNNYLDRTSGGFDDDEVYFCTCDYCGEAIYVGNTYYRLMDGSCCCEDCIEMCEAEVD